MKAFQKALMVGGSVLTLSVAFLGDLQAESLNEALAKAYENNPTLLAARASLRGVDEGVPQALANWRPTVTLSGDAGVSVQQSSVSGNQHRDPINMGLTVNQSLFRGGRTLAETSKAENDVKAARASLLGTEQSILLEGVRVYMNAFRDESVLKLNINNEQVLQRQLEAAQDRFRVGEITRTDVHQAEARLAGARADRIGAEAALEVSRAAYRNVIGDAPLGLGVPTIPDMLPDDLDEAVRLAATTNPAVQQALYQVDASKDDVDSVWGELLPELTLQGTADRDFDSAGPNTIINSMTAQVTLSVPLYQGGDVYSRLREAKQTVSELRFDVDQARRNALEDLTSAWENLTAARAQVASFRTQIEASEIALEGVQRESAVGSRTVLDVLDAEQELLNSRVSLVRAERDEVVAIYEVLEAVGRLTAKELELPVTLYNADDHYQEVRGRWFGGRSTGDMHDTPASEKR